MVTAKPIEPGLRKPLFGAAVHISYRYGGTSGRFAVAEVVARLFPHRRAFVERVAAEPPPTTFEFHPHPADRITYRGRESAEFVTPAQKRGLGTDLGFIAAGSSPIHGAVILTGEFPEHPDLLHVAVRLPGRQEALRTAIIREVLDRRH